MDGRKPHALQVRNRLMKGYHGSDGWCAGFKLCGSFSRRKPVAMDGGYHPSPAEKRWHCVKEAPLCVQDAHATRAEHFVRAECEKVHVQPLHVHAKMPH